LLGVRLHFDLVAFRWVGVRVGFSEVSDRATLAMPLVALMVI
jgi:hypothetical protein